MNTNSFFDDLDSRIKQFKIFNDIELFSMPFYIMISRVGQTFKPEGTSAPLMNKNIGDANPSVSDYVDPKLKKSLLIKNTFSYVTPIQKIKKEKHDEKLNFDNFFNVKTTDFKDVESFDDLAIDYTKQQKNNVVMEEYLKNKSFQEYKDLYKTFDAEKDKREQILAEIQQFNRKLEGFPATESQKDKLRDEFVKKLFDKMDNYKIEFRDQKGELLPEFQNVFLSMMKDDASLISAVDSMFSDDTTVESVAGAGAAAPPAWERLKLPKFSDLKRMKIDEIKKIISEKRLQVDTGLNPLTEKLYNKREILDQMYEFYYE